MDMLTELNPAQRQAIEIAEGPLLILAGPGSGKTRVITHRIAYLTKVCGINPRHIMAVTFTNKAAREMRERLEILLGQAVDSLTLGTFHAICARILRQEGQVMGLNSKFTIYDEDDQLKLIKQSMQEIGLDPKQYTPRAIQNKIKFAKSQLLTPGDYIAFTANYFEEIAQRVYEQYQNLLNQTQSLDFDDLLMKVVQLFDQHEDILSKYRSRYIHLLVDEFQDTNITQYKLTQQLAGKYRNICVVGDPDQSIFSWRYADIRNILSFEKDYPEAKVIVLEQNYRSTRTILEAASSIISANAGRKNKPLHTENEVGLPISLVQAYNEGEEAMFVVREIDRLISEESVSASDCAVMYRINAQSRALEEAFMRYGLPYKLVGGTHFYQRREVKDVIAYLRFIHNPYDNVSLMRIINVPGRGIGPRTLAELSSWAKSQNMTLFSALEMVAEKKGPKLATRASYVLTSFFSLIRDLIGKSKKLSLGNLLDEVVSTSGYRDYIMNEENGKDRWENIMELRTVTRDYNDLDPEEALFSFLEKVSLIADLDEVDEKSETSTLTTLHQAKGLEFPIVFIVGMEEGLLPYRRSLEEGGAELEEERRLCYVGITRAKERVYLIHTYRRSLFGISSESQVSRFTEDIPQHLLTKTPIKGKESDDTECTPITELYAKPYQPTKPIARPVNAITVSVGDYVRHTMFGEGVVTNCKSIKDDQQATIHFADAGIKKLLLSLAPMEKVENSDLP